MGANHTLPHGFSVVVRGEPNATATLEVFTHGGERWFRVGLDNGTSTTMALSKPQAEALSDAFLELAQRISS